MCINIFFGALCYFVFTKYYLGYQLEKDESGKECGMPRRDKSAYKTAVQKSAGKVPPWRSRRRWEVIRVTRD
jgi:hypothetical protein